MNPIQKQFIQYYTFLTNRNAKSIESVFNHIKKTQLQYEYIIDLMMVKNNLNGRCISLSNIPYRNFKKEIDLGYFGYSLDNKIDPFIKEKNNKLTTIFYNPAYISEKDVKNLIYRYWLYVKDRKKYKRMSILLAKKLGYIQPITLNNKKRTEKTYDSMASVHFNLYYKNHEIDFLYGQMIDLHNPKMIKKMHSYVRQMNRILNAIHPTLCIGQISIHIHKL